MDIGYWGIVDLLIKNGVDVNLPDEYGKTALQWSAGAGMCVDYCVVLQMELNDFS